jgi:XTP/dITP diphosphohydrolase
MHERHRFVLASGNPGKLRELAALLMPLGLEIAPQSEWQVPEAPEDAPTFLENALAKARNAASRTGLPAIADDSGLVVPALDGAPGIFSARFAGPGADDSANNRKLLAEMRDLSGPERAAYFHCTVVLLRHADDPVPLVASEDWWGEIATRARGRGGFGYDPLFWLADRQCTSAELPPAVKNRISHRGRAMHRLLGMLGRGSGGSA